MSLKVDTISLAFFLLGQEPVNDIATGNPMYGAVANVYDMLFEAEFDSSQPWRFSTGLQSLGLLTDKPIIDTWENIFQLPTDPELKTIWRVHPQSEFAIYEDKLYSNESEVILEYVFIPEKESIIPSSFKLMMTYKLVADVAMGITQQEKMSELYSKKAEIQQRIARSADSKSMPSMKLRSGESYNARFQSGNRGRI